MSKLEVWDGDELLGRASEPTIGEYIDGLEVRIEKLEKTERIHIAMAHVWTAEGSPADWSADGLRLALRSQQARIEALERRATLADELAMALKTLITLTVSIGRNDARAATVAVLRRYDATWEEEA